MLYRRFEINPIAADDEKVERLIVTVTAGRKIENEDELGKFLNEQKEYKGKQLLKATRQNDSWIADLSKERTRGPKLTLEQAVAIRDDHQHIIGKVTKAGFQITHVLVTPYEFGAGYFEAYLKGEFDERGDEEVLATAHNQKHKLEGYNVFVIFDPRSGFAIYHSLKEVLNDLGLPKIDYEQFGIDE